MQRTLLGLFDHLLKIALLVSIFFMSNFYRLSAQTDVMITGNGTITLDVVGDVNTAYNIILPNGCTADVTYQAWGGGGAGNIQRFNAVGGGGSGAYIDCSTPVSLSCGTTYTATVGAGGSAPGAAFSTTANGNDTKINFGTEYTAGGGQTHPTNPSSGGEGGATSPATAPAGCTFMDGTNGQGKPTNLIGGKGGDAPSGGTGGVGGDNDTDDQAGENDGGNGAIPGGGGGGHSRDKGPVSAVSGDGGHGRIIIMVTNYSCTEPTFTQLGPYCVGETPDILPTMSEDTPQITGTWNPSTINTSAEGTTTYTFTPTSGCASITTMDIVVKAAPMNVVNITGNGTYTLDVMNGADTNYDIVLPSGCTADVTYEAWGGGASGNVPGFNASGGGGSGAYISCTTPISLVCGTTYSATVGAGGIATVPPFTGNMPEAKNNGGDTQVNFPTGGTAGGGQPGPFAGNAGPGGTATGACTVTNGNDGGTKSTNNLNGGAGGNAPNGGTGGAGGINATDDQAGENDGEDGVTPGGGGGGNSRDKGPRSAVSGNGGHGRLIFTITNYNCVEPTFTQLGPYCVDETPDMLPLNSEDTPPIPGTWDPATINTSAEGTTTYTFTPTSGCTSTTTMDIVVSTTAPTCVTPCPVVNAPISTGDKEICEGETTPALIVNAVGTGETVDWYDAAAGGNLLLSGNISYTSPETTVGVYTYYAQTRVVSSGCVSSRTAITLTIKANPTLTLGNTNCSLDGTTYDLDFTSNGTVMSDFGDVDNTASKVTGIPAGKTVTLTATLNGCSTTGMQVAPFCSSNMFSAEDPCTCNGDQQLNVDGTISTTGTFNETVTITGPPNQIVRVKTLSSTTGIVGLAVGTMLVETPIGSGVYQITFSHTDRTGYNITEFESSADNGMNYTTIMNGGMIIQVANVCAYPQIVCDPTLPNSVELNNAPITLGTNLLTTNPSFTTLTGFPIAAINGTTATSFDPLNAPAVHGNNTIVFTYDFETGTGAGGTIANPAIPLDADNDATNGVCPIRLTKIININFDPCQQYRINNVTWTGATSTDWNEPTNWSTGTVPEKGDQVTFNTSAMVTGAPQSSIDRLFITDNANVSFNFTNELVVSRNTTYGGRGNAVFINTGSSLTLDWGDFHFTTDETCDNVSNILFNRGILTINRGVNVRISPGKAFSASKNATNNNGGSIVNCGTLLIDGGFTGNGLVNSNNADFHNNGVITFEPILTKNIITVTTGATFLNECAAVINNNNLTNSVIVVSNAGEFRNFGFLKSKIYSGPTLRVNQGVDQPAGLAWNYGYFYNANGDTRFAVGSSSGVSDLGQSTTISSLHELLATPGFEFSRCSGANRSCGNKAEIIPTLSDWGLMVFSLLLLNISVFFIKRKEHFLFRK